MEHRVLVKRIYRLWMCEPRGVEGFRSLRAAPPSLLICPHSSPPVSLSSLLCHFGGEPGGLPGLVDCGWDRSQLRPGPALAASLHSLQLCVLVPARIQGLPVRQVQGPAGHRTSLTCWTF